MATIRIRIETIRDAHALTPEDDCVRIGYSARMNAGEVGWARIVAAEAAP